ncbi:methylated-DNA--[protein]-cysteine S-methyltransferase [Pseudoramibacter sp.]|jgi:methylated-DNA-[protein]-cysteine S-methyltransferase|uniref:methylated-DNA--[protein]-cysteine S-methyltransferase n=1 Tax=Pseudoramibacter sp. TaxID=2034862 RepID=UPI0025DCA3FA|nr:methylated-DNA--[protein]-cysteine S-methyltransferase [Pseudoramibacter sp.]
MSEHYINYFKPPFGLLLLESTEDVLLRVRWVKSKDVPETETRPILEETKKQLQEYFDGKRQNFDLSFNARGTAFQKKVWKVLRQIPYGEIKSYKDIADAINNPTAPRAVGRANNKNPLNIIIPCHRVIATSGLLTGYAGGVEIKKKLLELERHYLRNFAEKANES